MSDVGTQLYKTLHRTIHNFDLEFDSTAYDVIAALECVKADYLKALHDVQAKEGENDEPQKQDGPG